MAALWRRGRAHAALFFSSVLFHGRYQTFGQKIEADLAAPNEACEFFDSIA
jgi:hypothetical protein